MSFRIFLSEMFPKQTEKSKSNPERSYFLLSSLLCLYFALNFQDNLSLLHKFYKPKQQPFGHMKYNFTKQRTIELVKD